jgi:hypothetical protein
MPFRVCATLQPGTDARDRNIQLDPAVYPASLGKSANHFDGFNNIVLFNPIPFAVFPLILKIGEFEWN